MYARDLRRHPTDYHDFTELQTRIQEARRRGLRLVRVALGISGDGWTAYAGKRLGIKSIYKFYCNDSWDALQSVDSYDCIGQMKKGVDEGACMQVYEPQIKQLQRGYEAHLDPNGRAFIYGGVCFVPADHPQAQEFAGCLSGATANYPDRFSHIHKSELGDLTYDLQGNRKTLDHVRNARAQQAADPKSNATKDLLKGMGLHCKKSLFESLAMDTTTASSPLNDHCAVLGQLGKAVTRLLQELTPRGRKVLVQALHQQPLPPHWPPLTTPRLSSSDNKLMMGIEDLKHLVQIAPFAFAGDLLKLPTVRRVVSQHPTAVAPRVTFTDDALKKYHARADKTKGLVKVFIEMARSVQAVFAKERLAGCPEDNLSYMETLEEIILDGLRTLQANWPGQFCTINVVNARHFAESVDIYGFPAGLSTCMLELMHTLYKHKVSTTSGRETVIELMQYENFRQAARHLLQVLEHPEAAVHDPVITCLPDSIHQDLLDSKNTTLRALLRPRPTKSQYVPIDRTGPEVVSFVRPALLSLRC